MLSLFKQQSNTERSAWREWILSYLGLAQGTDSRELMERGGEFLVTDLAQKASQDPLGYAMVRVPFSFLPRFLGGGDIQNICVVTNLKLARWVGNYGVSTSNFDSSARLPYNITETIMGIENLVNRNDPQVKSDRKEMKRVMHDFDRILRVVKSEFGLWLETESQKPKTNMESSIKQVMIKILGQSLLGIHHFPPDFNHFILILDYLDEAMTLFDLDNINKYEALMRPYSHWFYQHNHETMFSRENSIIPYLVGDERDPHKVNLAGAFLVTSNITKLIYFSVIFFMTHPEWQSRLRGALHNNSQNLLHAIYKELCRLYVPTNIPRYTSKEITYQDGDDEMVFPPYTMFYVLGRFIRMNPKIFPHPEVFRPERFLGKNDIRMNSIELSPFGIGTRQCPAASQFTEKFWRCAMETIFDSCEIKAINDIKLENVPPEARFIKLRNQYFGQVEYLSLISPD